MSWIDIDCAPLFDELMVLVGHPDYWLSRRSQPLDAAKLNGVPLIVYSKEVGHRTYLDDMLAKAGVKPDIVMELDNVALILQYVEMKVGVAFVPLSAIKHTPAETKLSIIKVNGLPRLRRRKYVLIDQEPEPSYEVRTLFEYLVNFPWNVMWHEMVPGLTSGLPHS